MSSQTLPFLCTGANLTLLIQPGHYVDLSTPENREWWGKQYEDLFNWGLEFVWQDMTTPAIGEAYGDMKGFVSLTHSSLMPLATC
jgi:alpha-glucosidase (family GH31 glycosyl hydrolase)